MATSYDLANARRTLFVELRDPPRKVGIFEVVPPSNGQGKIPFILPWSRLELGTDEFVDTVPFGDYNDESGEGIHYQPDWGVVIGVEYRPRSGGFPQAPQGTTDQFAVHEFGWV